MKLNKLRSDIVRFLCAEYSKRDATEQVCNANVFVNDKKINVIYDNGVAETLFYNKQNEIDSLFDGGIVNIDAPKDLQEGQNGRNI